MSGPPVEAFEKRAEEKSLYVAKLRKSFGNSSHIEFYRDCLLDVFRKKDIEPFSSTNFQIYLILSPSLHSKLKKAMMDLEHLTEEGSKRYIEDKVEDLSEVLDKVYTEALESGIPLILVEIALKKWLKSAVKKRVYSRITRKFSLILQFIKKRTVKKEKIKNWAFGYLNKAKNIPCDLKSVKLDSICEFIDYPSLFKSLLRNLSDKYIQKKKVSIDISEDNGTVRNIKETVERIKNRIKEKMVSVSDTIEERDIDNLGNIIFDMEKLINSTKAKISGLKRERKRKEILKSKKKLKLPPILHFFDAKLVERIGSEIEEVRGLINSEIDNIPDDFVDRQFLGKKINCDAIIEWFLKVYKDIFIPTILELIFEEMVSIWPPDKIRSDSLEEARWIGIMARKEDPKTVYFLPEVDREEEEIEFNLKEYRKCVSVLVYDIRGSTIMGDKLKDAEKEDEIRNKFQFYLSNIIRKYNGFILKDTGDGAIVFFSRDSGEKFYEYRSFLNGSRGKLKDEELTLHSSADSSFRAVGCARAMLDASEAFVRKHLNHYKEWFKDFEEKDIEFGGVTYEKLPPEYKRIFQLGIGIASGKPGRDLYLGKNIIGIPDLTGNLVREANIYSGASHPERSVILVDPPTMFNLLLYLEKFDLKKDDNKIKKHSYKMEKSELLKEAVSWMKGLNGYYLVDEFKMALKRIDYFKEDNFEYEKISSDDKNYRVERNEDFYDPKLDLKRVIYEIIPE